MTSHCLTCDCAREFPTPSHLDKQTHSTDIYESSYHGPEHVACTCQFAGTDGCKESDKCLPKNSNANNFLMDH